MENPSKLSLSVCHADVASNLGFHRSAAYFHNGGHDRDWLNKITTLLRVAEPLTIPEGGFVVVQGDVLADVDFRDGGTILIYGNLRSSLRTAGICEVVLAGDLRHAAAVDADGIVKVFIGGTVHGCVRSRGSCTLWVEGDMRGQLWTGNPSTDVIVAGDCSATIRPSGEPSLLYMNVGGFMSYAWLETAAAVGYTEFNASVGRSDKPAGLHPEQTVYNAFRQHRSYNRWVVRRST